MSLHATYYVWSFTFIGLGGASFYLDKSDAVSMGCLVIAAILASTARVLKELGK